MVDTNRRILRNMHFMMSIQSLRIVWSNQTVPIFVTNLQFALTSANKFFVEYSPNQHASDLLRPSTHRI